MVSPQQAALPFDAAIGAVLEAEATCRDLPDDKGEFLASDVEMILERLRAMRAAAICDAQLALAEMPRTCSVIDFRSKRVTSAQVVIVPFPLTPAGA